MQYMILRKSDASTEAGELPGPALLAAMGAYNQELAKAGMLLGGEGLQASSKGALIRFSGGKPTVTDGPFTEAKELIAGFTMMEAASREEVLEWLKRWPQEDADGNTSLEIREGGCPGGLRGVAGEGAPTLPEGFRRFMICSRPMTGPKPASCPTASGWGAWPNTTTKPSRPACC
jgi:hypothetical protein